MQVVLQDWALILDPSYQITGYEAPETIPYKLTGKCYGHDRFEDGTEITTSVVIEKIDDETYKTASGTIYKVGKKNVNYELFCQEYNSCL